MERQLTIQQVCSAIRIMRKGVAVTISLFLSVSANVCKY